jgi:hypothetical protein
MLYRTIPPPAPPEKPYIPTMQHMTLRDWFAGIAMQGILCNCSLVDTHDTHAQEWVARHAYEQADIMLKEGEHIE